jgi:hypothetical protein
MTNLKLELLYFTIHCYMHSSSIEDCRQWLPTANIPPSSGLPNCPQSPLTAIAQNDCTHIRGYYKYRSLNTFYVLSFTGRFIVTSKQNAEHSYEN